jgi:hypothetical protein
MDESRAAAAWAGCMQIAQNIEAPFTTTDAARRWLVPGLTAGTAFLAIEMLAGSVSTTAWSFSVRYRGDHRRRLALGRPGPRATLVGILLKFQTVSGRRAKAPQCAGTLCTRGTGAVGQDWREWRRLRAWELKQQGWQQRAIARALG